MNAVKVNDGYTTFTRISKVAAFKAWVAGEPVAMCPAKLRPGAPFASHMVMRNVESTREEWPSFDPYSGYWPNQQVTDRMRFDRYAASFTQYNCCHETGYYPAFYLVR